MNWKFLKVAAIAALHEEQIARFGGSHGLRDSGLLESAMLRPQNSANYDPNATAAATLGWGLIKNHAFIDGKKRTGLAGKVAFLHVNGFRLTCSAAEETLMVQRAAASEISEEEWTAWAERSVAAASE